MNKAASKRIISKQEASVLLADLDLFTCTETIESVSISNSIRLTTSDVPSSTKTFIRRYANRPGSCERMSLRDYFHHVKNGDNKPLIIPNFVGVGGTPCFPVSIDYARHTLIVNRPWRHYPTGIDWIREFDAFVHSPDCPRGPKITYERVMQRFYEEMTHYEPKATSPDHSSNPLCPEDEELLLLTGLKSSQEYDAEDLLFQSLDKGINFKWDSAPMVCTLVRMLGYPQKRVSLIPLIFRTVTCLIHRWIQLAGSRQRLQSMKRVST